MKARTGFNPKRRLAAKDSWTAGERAERAKKALYGGNPEHKIRPGDYGLPQTTNRYQNKTLCDADRKFLKAEAEELLKEGLRKGMISVQKRNEWPQNVWAVSADQQVFEAQLENQDNGTYHGYPLPESDDFRLLVLSEWPNR